MAIQPKNDTAIKVDTITEKTTDAGVTIETMTVEDGAVGAVTTLDMTGALTTDTINEHTTAAGVTIEGVELKDSYATLSSVSAPSTPAANEIVLYDASGDLIAKDSAGDTWNLTSGYTDFTPTITATGGTVSAVTITGARYRVFGPSAHIYLYFSGTLSTTAITTVHATLPVTAASTHRSYFSGVASAATNAEDHVLCRVVHGTATLDFFGPYNSTSAGEVWGANFWIEI